MCPLLEAGHARDVTLERSGKIDRRGTVICTDRLSAKQFHSR